MCKKISILFSAMVILSIFLTACGPSSPPQVDEPAPTQGAPSATMESPVEPTPAAAQPSTDSTTGVVYQKKDTINEGKPTKITFWSWSDSEFFKARFDEYEKMYPNVDIEYVVLPWDEFWTKLTASLPAGQGPDFYYFHNMYHTAIVGNGFAAPFPVDLFDPVYMDEHRIGMKEKYYHDNQGRLAYLPLGEMVGALYINKKMWDAAGLTEQDYPKTWDDVMTVAKKLTKLDDSGKIDIAGFAPGGDIWATWMDMMSQQGRYLFTKDGRGCQFDSPEARKALDQILSYYDANVISRDFPSGFEAFGSEKLAMLSAWTWMTKALKGTYPNVEFITVPGPTFTGEDFPSRGKFNYESGPAVNAQAPEENKGVAFDILHYIFSNPKFVNELSIIAGVAPPDNMSFSHPDILADKTTADAIKVLPYTTFMNELAGELASAVYTEVDQAILAGKTADEIISSFQAVCNKTMQAGQYFVAERNYQYDDKMIPNQP